MLNKKFRTLVNVLKMQNEIQNNQYGFTNDSDIAILKLLWENHFSFSLVKCFSTLESKNSLLIRSHVENINLFCFGEE